MPRVARNAPGGLVYHVINRANGRLRLFRKDADYLAFEAVLCLAMERRPVRLLDWCVMPNHWHFVVWPRRDDDLTEFFRWLTHTHTQRWHAAQGTSGMGHLYQGRFKAFPIQQDDHLANVLRYVQSNPTRAKLSPRLPDWRWGSCHVRHHGSPEMQALLSNWPIEMPSNWSAWLAKGLDKETTERIALSLRRSRPLGDETWTRKMTKRLGLEWTTRPRGRPRAQSEKESRPL